jgi:hypothetical protein
MLLISRSASRCITVDLCHALSTVALSHELDEIFRMLLMTMIALIILATSCFQGEGTWFTFTARMSSSFMLCRDGVQFLSISNGDVGDRRTARGRDHIFAHLAHRGIAQGSTLLQ